MLSAERDNEETNREESTDTKSFDNSSTLDNESIDNKSVYSESTDSEDNDCEAIYRSKSSDREIYVVLCVFSTVIIEKKKKMMGNLRSLIE